LHNFTVFYGNATQSLCGITFIIAKKAAAVSKKYKILFFSYRNNNTISYKVTLYLIEIFHGL